MKYTLIALTSAAVLAGAARAHTIVSDINAFSDVFDTFAGDAEGELGSSATLSSGATISISSPNGSTGWIYNYPGDGLPNPYPGDEQFLGLYGYNTAGQSIPIDITLTYDFNQTGFRIWHEYIRLR